MVLMWHSAPLVWGTLTPGVNHENAKQIRNANPFTEN
jgi:hypothetical protein